MEFLSLKELFDTLASIKHKYRIVGKYIKTLQGKTDEKEQQEEVDRFTKFLLTNPDIGEKRFTNPELKDKDTIYMNCAVKHLSPAETAIFWSKLRETEQIFFPNGRPTVTAAKQEQASFLESEEAQRLVNNDPLLSEVMRQVVNSGAINGGMDVGSIMQDPKFTQLAESITKNLTTGKYTKDHLEQTVNTLTGLVGDDVDPELKKMMTFLQKSVKDIKAGRPADLSVLSELVSSFDFGGAENPIMQMICGKK